MAEWQIREARPGDRVAIGGLWRELMFFHQGHDSRFVMAPDGHAKYIRHVHEMIRSRDARVLVAEVVETGEIVAYIMGEMQVRPPMALPGLYGFLSEAYVQEEWRQKGVGRALFESLRTWFLAHKAQAIELFVSEENPAALAFWQEMGFLPFLKTLRLEL